MLNLSRHNYGFADNNIVQKHEILSKRKRDIINGSYYYHWFFVLCFK